MPYKLRKAPKRDLYWVVSEDGTKRSKEPITLERAKAQMRALYSSERMRGGEEAPPPPPPTFKEYLDSTGFKSYGAENLNTEFITPEGNLAQRAITNPDDVIKFDKARNETLVSGATPRAKYEKRAEQMAKLGKPIQSYDKYLEQLTANAKSRSTTNASAEGRQKYYLKKQEEAGRIQEKYYKQYPDQRPVMCSFLEDGSRGKEETTTGECKRRKIIAEHKAAREMNGAFINTLVDIGDFASNTLMPLIPGVSQIAAPIYQALAPPGSQYYSDAPVTDKLLNAAAGAAAAAMKMKGKGRKINKSDSRNDNLPLSLKLTAKRGAGKKNLNMFELFKGTGSIGKVAKRMGYNVISLDFDPIYTPDIETDILNWDYKKWAEENKFVPDYIWASPPCNTFSTLAYRLKERNTKTAVPHSARAREGTAILHKTIEIIKFFQRKNPKLLFTIENPRGMMRHDSEIKKLPNRETTLYCLYGDFKRKPTDFWSNFPMELKPHTDKYDKTGVIPNLANLSSIEQRYSIPSKLVKAILTRAREYYGTEPLMGAGFFGDFWNAAKSIGKKIVSVVSNVVSGKAIRSDYPPYVRSLIAEIGDKPITEIFVRREPLKAAYDTALNLVTRGKWSEGKKKYAYDNLFHLGMEVIVKMSDQDEIYKRYVIEKNDVINIEPEKKAEPNTEKMKVTMGGTGHTINTLLNGGKQILGSKFFPYDAFTNNCQDFIISLLTGSGLGDDAVRAFVKQPLEGIVANLPSYTSSIARGITDLGGVVNTARYGQGGLNPSRELAAQFKKWGVNPVDYLAEAKKKAKEAGLADNLLGFSSDAKHKLQIPNTDGKMIRFGATGLGDYILYTLSKNPDAKEHRKHYLQRAMKIKGDWAKDPYSPNSLSVSIQW